jgi:hypothetical protein
MSLADLKPRFAINPIANDIKATAILGCGKPIAPLGFLGWASGRANGTVAATGDAFGVPGRNGGTEEMSLADLKTQPPRFAHHPIARPSGPR